MRSQKKRVTPCGGKGSPPMNAYFNPDLELASSELDGERAGEEHSRPRTSAFKGPRPG